MNKVLCFGDSNTFGFNPKNGSRFDKSIRWTGILQRLCENKFHIIEAGCNNRTAFSDNPAGKMFSGYKILPELLQKNLSIVILAIGINDLQFQYNVNVNDIKNGITNLIKIIQNNNPNTKIILVSPNELTENVLKSPIFSTLFDESSIEKSKILPLRYAQIAKENKCDFIDLNTFVTPSEIDGLHFEPKEHKRIAQEIFNHLNKTWQNTEKSIL